ncbi:MAG: thiamine pyrophosphate-dependent enzyme [Desulfurococcaceae archaeon]
MVVPVKQPTAVTKRTITWCPGCGNFSILSAFIDAVNDLGLEPWRVVVVSGIGCSGKITNYMPFNGAHVIHGRVIPFAMGVKLVNPELIVVGFSGDGDAYAIGIEHLPHAIRRNIDVKLVVHNNKVFGLTTGQVSPTSDKGMITRTTPWGNVEEPINPIAMAISLGASFVARGFSGDIGHLKYLFKEALKHKGFSLIDVLQPCVTYDRVHTYQWYRERIYRLEDVGHDPANFNEALKKAYEWGDRIPIGLFYRVKKPTFEEMLPATSEGPPLVARPISNRTIRDLLVKNHGLTLN